MNRVEAESFVYQSYLKAEKFQDCSMKDSEKRRPDLTKKIIRKKAGTPCVVVTGSKGKGSVANMISQIMQTKYKVGLMTSPHLINFCERFKINGESINDADFVKYIGLIQQEIEEIERQIPKDVCISPMGIQTDMALTYFNENNTEFNVFECGKGAKFDDVNNVAHDYAVINSIFSEHTHELGSSIQVIAEDKAHVINGEQKCVYVAEQTADVLQIIRNRASIYGTPLKIYGKDFYADRIRYLNSGMVFDVVIGKEVYSDILIPLMGKHQAKNCALAMALCLDVLKEFDFRYVKRKLLDIAWPGRMEIISRNPLIVLDACINPVSCANVKDVMKHLGIASATVVIGIPNNKDYAGVVREMKDVASEIILTKSQNLHYVFSSEQCKKMTEEGIPTTWVNNIESAIEHAITKNNPVVILGTTSLLSEIKILLLEGKLCVSSDTL